MAAAVGAVGSSSLMSADSSLLATPHSSLLTPHFSLLTRDETRRERRPTPHDAAAYSSSSSSSAVSWTGVAFHSITHGPPRERGALDQALHSIPSRTVLLERGELERAAAGARVDVDHGRGAGEHDRVDHLVET